MFSLKSMSPRLLVLALFVLFILSASVAVMAQSNGETSVNDGQLLQAESNMSLILAEALNISDAPETFSIKGQRPEAMCIPTNPFDNENCLCAIRYCLFGTCWYWNVC